MRIYTRKGDGGVSSLLSGERVKKNSLRMQAYGTVDELNCAIGGVVANLPEFNGRIFSQLRTVQTELFQLGAQLAATPDSDAANRLTPMQEEQFRRLERQIDGFEEGLLELRNFILPGGHPAAAWAHLARTICRRAERCTVSLIDSLSGESHKNALLVPIAYLNRLSDYLFVVARACNREAGFRDILFKD